jgi:ERCC4-type nuclease
MLTIQVDYREADLYKNIQHFIETTEQFKNLKVEVKNLSLGDIAFVEKVSESESNMITHLLIERKTLGDLVASIKDGRYEEQSYRLNHLDIPNHNILYLIEGDINKRNFYKENKDEKRMIFSALFSMNYYKGFSVIRTVSLEETALFICNSADKMIKSAQQGKTAYHSLSKNKDSTICLNPISEEEEETSKKEKDKEYVNVMKKTKKEHITKENIGEIFLSQIPSISSKTAIAIMEKGKTMANLIHSIQTDKDFLKNISYLDHKGKPRKISNKSIQNIYDFLCDETTTTNI